MRTILIGLLLTTFSLSAEEGGETKEIKTAIDVLSYFVGSCWEGTFADGQSTDTHCMTSVYGHFVRDVHVVAGRMGPYSGESMYRWNATDKQLEYTYWASDGGMSQGVLIPSVESFVSPAETYTSASGETQTFITRWRIDGPDQWTQSSETLPTEGSKVLWEISYRRRPLQ